MNIKIVRLHNFMSYKDSQIDLSGDGIYCIIGETGSGKSAIREAIEYALFGQTNRSDKMEELVNDSESEMYVELTFSLNDVDYTIKRGINKGSSFIEAGELQGNTIPETQVKIEQKLGFDFKTFLHTTCFEQGKSDAFSLLKPTEAKQMIINLLHLDIYNDCLEEVKDNIDKYSNDRDKVAMELSILKSAIQGLQPEENEDIIVSKINEKEKELGKLNADMNGILLKKEDVQEKQTQIHSLLGQLQTETGSIQGQIESIEKKLKKILELKTDERCPLCDSVLTGANKEEAVAHLTSEKNVLQEMLDKGIEKLNKQTDAYNSVNTIIKQADLEINRLKNQQTELKLAIKESEGFLKRIKEKRDIANKNQKDIEVKEKEFLRLQSIIDLFTPLKDVFGKNGIPVYIIDKVLPEVEMIANDILEKLTNGKFSVIINTQREVGNKLSETFEIKILTQGKQRGYKLYSGGQRFVIDLALRTALSVILARRKNFTIETLIIDEGFGALDLRNRQLVIYAINELYKKFNLKKLILMTHCEEISENVERTLKVEMKNGESSVE